MAAPLRKCFLKFISTRNISNVKALSATKCHARLYSTSENKEIDPGPIFMRKDVQMLLKRITAFDLDKVFKHRPTKLFKTPEYELLTDAQLKQKRQEAEIRARHIMQMPPYLNVREEKEEVLSDDPEIDGHDNCNIVFTDVTYWITDKERFITVREPGGKLRKANYAERNRIREVYFPSPGRFLHYPQMFKEEELEKVLGRLKAEYILDRACVQFEPDDSEYIRISRRVYEYINHEKKYHDLRYSRHFGPLCFYLAHHQKIEGVMVDMIQRDLLSDAADMVKLYHIVHSNEVALDQINDVNDDVYTIKVFLEHDSRSPGMVELALQTYLESKQKTKSAV